MGKAKLYLILVNICFLVTAWRFATGVCPSYDARIEETSLQGHAIACHVLKTITGVDFEECFIECSQSCHCRSFNLHLEGNGVCELHVVSKEVKPRALRARNASRFIQSNNKGKLIIPWDIYNGNYNEIILPRLPADKFLHGCYILLGCVILYLSVLQLLTC